MQKLINDLTRGSVQQREVAAIELGQLQSSDALPYLIAALRDSDLYVRVAAIQGLSDLKNAAAVPTLCELVLSQLHEPLIVSNVCIALSEIRSSAATATLMELLSGDEPFTRYEAAYALGEIGDQAAVPALTKLLTDTTMPEREDQDTLYSVGEQAQRALDLIASQRQS